MEPASSFLDASVLSSQTLSTTKMSDKRAEQDVELLRNRIRMLRAEEERAKAKVAETKKRQDEILAVRARKEQSAQQRAEQRLAEEEKVRKQREERLSKKAESRMAVKQRLDQMYAQRRDEAAKLKMEEAQNEQLLRSIRTEQVANAQRRREQILTHQRRTQSELSRQRQAQQQELIRNFLRMISEEEAKRAKVEMEIREMEKEELEQIEKLRKLQEEQRQSFDELELALAEGQ